MVPEVVEDFNAIPPNIDRAVLAQALVIEAVHLPPHTTLSTVAKPPWSDCTLQQNSGGTAVLEWWSAMQQPCTQCIRQAQAAEEKLCTAYLGNLPALVIAAYEKDSVGVSDL